VPTPRITGRGTTRVIRLLAVPLLLLTSLVVSAAPSQAAAVCSAKYLTESYWPADATHASGFVSNVSITNQGTSPSKSWNLFLIMPAGATITFVGTAQLTQAPPAYIASSYAWEAVLTPNSSLQLTIVGTFTGTPASPRPTTMFCGMSWS